jgi:hypothetical protein
MDILLLLLVSVASCIIYRIVPEPRIFILPLYIGVTFFLFCTVFRVTWYDEIFWYLPFVIVMPYAVVNIESFWLFILAIFEPLRAAIVIYRMKKGPYVGAFYKKINKYEYYTPLTYKDRVEKMQRHIMNKFK